MKITKQQIIMIVILLIIGYAYSQYNNKLANGIEKEENDLINEYLASDVKKWTSVNHLCGFTSNMISTKGTGLISVRETLKI